MPLTPEEQAELDALKAQVADDEAKVHRASVDDAAGLVGAGMSGIGRLGLGLVGLEPEDIGGMKMALSDPHLPSAHDMLPHIPQTGDEALQAAEDLAMGSINPLEGIVNLAKRTAHAVNPEAYEQGRQQTKQDLFDIESPAIDVGGTPIPITPLTEFAGQFALPAMGEGKPGAPKTLGFGKTVDALSAASPDVGALARRGTAGALRLAGGIAPEGGILGGVGNLARKATGKLAEKVNPTPIDLTADMRKPAPPANAQPDYLSVVDEQMQETPPRPEYDALPPLVSPLSDDQVGAIQTHLRNGNDVKQIAKAMGLDVREVINIARDARMRGDPVPADATPPIKPEDLKDDLGAGDTNDTIVDEPQTKELDPTRDDDVAAAFFANAPREGAANKYGLEPNRAYSGEELGGLINRYYEENPRPTDPGPSDSDMLSLDRRRRFFEEGEPDVDAAAARLAAREQALRLQQEQAPQGAVDDAASELFPDDEGGSGPSTDAGFVLKPAAMPELPDVEGAAQRLRLREQAAETQVPHGDDTIPGEDIDPDPRTRQLSAQGLYDETPLAEEEDLAQAAQVQNQGMGGYVRVGNRAGPNDYLRLNEGLMRPDRARYAPYDDAETEPGAGAPVNPFARHKPGQNILRMAGDEFPVDEDVEMGMAQDRGVSDRGRRLTAEAERNIKEMDEDQFSDWIAGVDPRQMPTPRGVDPGRWADSKPWARIQYLWDQWQRAHPPTADLPNGVQLAVYDANGRLEHQQVLPDPATAMREAQRHVGPGKEVGVIPMFSERGPMGGAEHRAWWSQDGDAFEQVTRSSDEMNNVVEHLGDLFPDAADANHYGAAHAAQRAWASPTAVYSDLLNMGPESEAFIQSLPDAAAMRVVDQAIQDGYIPEDVGHGDTPATGDEARDLLRQMVADYEQDIIQGNYEDQE